MISVQIWYRLLLWGGGGWTLFLDTGCMWSDWAVGLEIRVAPAQLRRPGRSHFTSIKSIHLLNEKSVSLQCSITSIKPMDLKTVFLLWYLELSWVLPWIAQCCPSRRVSPLWATSWRPSDVTGADGMEFASAYLLIWPEMFFLNSQYRHCPAAGSKFGSSTDSRTTCCSYSSSPGLRNNWRNIIKYFVPNSNCSPIFSIHDW